MRSIAGLYQKCPIDFLRLECNLEPLAHRLDKVDQIHQEKYNRLPLQDDRRKLLNPQAPNRLTTREGWTHSVMKRQMQIITEEEQDLPTIPPWEKLENLNVDRVQFDKPKAEYTNHELREKAIEKITSIQADYIVYTDGSTSGNQANGGAGIYVEDNNNNAVIEESRPAGILCSSYAGECAALFHALRWMTSTVDDTEQPNGQLHFLVCTDSKSLCDALGNVTWKERDYWIVKIQEQLYKLDAMVTLLWIPAHCDIEGNEKADELAKKGAEKDQSGVPVSHKIVTAKIKSKKWDIVHPRARHIYNDRRTPKMEAEKKWSRKVRSAYARIRTGHAKELKEYRHRVFQKEDDPNCNTCGVPEDTEHATAREPRKQG